MLKQQLSSIARTNEDLQDKLKDCTSELRQRNQDVHRSLNEYKELKSRLATKSEVIRRQEKLVEQLRSKLLDNERDLRSMNDEIKSLSHKHSSVQRELEDAKDTIRQKDVTIENDKQVRDYNMLITYCKYANYCHKNVIPSNCYGHRFYFVFI